MNKQSAHRPRKRFGQNFLQDKFIIDRIVDAVAPERAQRLVEIGPGQGAITHRVIARLKEQQQLTVVELDRDLAEVFSALAQENQSLEVLQADILKVDLGELLQSPDGDVKLFGNLPYNISTPLLLRLVEAQIQANLKNVQLCKDMVFMLQKEVVDRIVASAGSKTYGRLSVVLQSVFDAEPLFDVPPSAFYPAPKVMSSILRLSPKAVPAIEAKDFALFQKIVTAAFSQRRKTLKNTLKNHANASVFAAADIDPGLRAETLTVDQFVGLSKAVEAASESS